MISNLTYWNRTKLAISLCVIGVAINLTRQYFDLTLWLNPLSLLFVMAGIVGCIANIMTYDKVKENE